MSYSFIYLFFLHICIWLFVSMWENILFQMFVSAACGGCQLNSDVARRASMTRSPPVSFSPEQYVWGGVKINIVSLFPDSPSGCVKECVRINKLFSNLQYFLLFHFSIWPLLLLMNEYKNKRITFKADPVTWFNTAGSVALVSFLFKSV